MTVSTYVCENYKCWNCEYMIAISFARDTDRPEHQTYTPAEYLDPYQVRWAREHGVKLEMRYTAQTKMTYLANVCHRCDEVQGNFYIVRHFERFSNDALRHLRRITWLDDQQHSPGWYAMPKLPTLAIKTPQVSSYLEAVRQLGWYTPSEVDETTFVVNKEWLELVSFNDITKNIFGIALGAQPTYHDDLC